jgi:hypothetical protein
VYCICGIASDLAVPLWSHRRVEQLVRVALDAVQRPGLLVAGDLGRREDRLLDGRVHRDLGQQRAQHVVQALQVGRQPHLAHDPLDVVDEQALGVERDDRDVLAGDHAAVLEHRLPSITYLCTWRCLTFFCARQREALVQQVRLCGVDLVLALELWSLRRWRAAGRSSPGP